MAIKKFLFAKKKLLYLNNSTKYTWDKMLISFCSVDNSFGVTNFTALGLDLTVTSFPNLSWT